MFGLPLLDILVIIGYFIVIIIIGIASAKRIRNQEDYLMGGRNFGKIIQTFAAFGQGTSADNAVGVSRTVFVDGIAGIWSSLLTLFATPVYWLTSPWYRRLRILTLAEFFEERYESRRMSILYALMGIVGLMAMVAIGISAMSKTVLALTPKPMEALTVEEYAEYTLAVELADLESRNFSELDETEVERMSELRLIDPRMHFSYMSERVLIYSVCVIIIIYGSLGGLAAAFLTDLIQGVFIILLSVILLPFAIFKVSASYGDGSFFGGIGALREQLPQSALEVFGSPIAIDFTWYFVLAASLLSLANTAVQPNQLVAIGSAKDEHTARVGYVTGNFMKRIVILLWGYTGLFAIILYAKEIRNPDLVWGQMTLDLVGSLGLGLVGLMIACMLSALMSTADCQMITAAGLFTKSFYNKILPPQSESHYVWVGRLFSVVFILLSAALATAFDDILSLLKFSWGFFAVFAATFWLGLLWRRANRLAAWTSISISAILFILGPPLIPSIFPSMRTAPALLVQNADRVVENTYVATQADLDGTEGGGELGIGDLFTKTFKVSGQSIFWEQGVNYDEGKISGRGSFHLDLWVLKCLGADLEGNTRAMNESIRFLMRLIIPFGLVILMSLLIRRKPSEQVERFFVKMRLPVDVNPITDERNLREAQVELNYGRESLMFPESSWEFQKWSKADLGGFLICCSVVGIILMVLYLMVS